MLFRSVSNQLLRKSVHKMFSLKFSTICSVLIFTLSASAESKETSIFFKTSSLTIFKIPEKVVCYWFSDLVPANQIDPFMCTHIVYSFLGIGSDGSLNSEDRSEAEVKGNVLTS
jgi:hypothetical protein